MLLVCGVPVQCTKCVSIFNSTILYVHIFLLAARFYPSLGPYSSLSTSTLNDHMEQLREAGIGVLIVSWYPPGLADDHGKPLDPLMPAILDAAHQYKLKVCFHIEPYKNRTPESVVQDLRYLRESYGAHPATLLICPKSFTIPDQNGQCTSSQQGTDMKGTPRLLVYVYDSYHISHTRWADVLQPTGRHTIRGTEIDGQYTLFSKKKVDLESEEEKDQSGGSLML
jgi:glycoprotein endo-alpha-1,2-mannosidase